MPFDPSTVKINTENTDKDAQVVSKFDPTTVNFSADSTPKAIPRPVQAQETTTSDKIKSYSGAVIGGLANAGADIVQGVGDTAPWVLKHLNLISPETANKIYDMNKQSTDLGRTNGSEDDFIGKGVSDHPFVATGTKVAGDIAGLTYGLNKAGAVADVAKGLFKGIPTVASTATRAIGQGLVGQAGANPDQKDSAFLLNTAISPVADLVGYGLGKLGSKATAVDTINQELANNTKDKTTALFDKVKQIPFSSTDLDKANTVAQDMKDFITSNSDKMSKVQNRLLNSYSDQLQNATSHDDVYNILKNMGSNTTAFVKNTSTPIQSAFFDLKSNVGDVINSAAEREGVPGALSNATIAYKKAGIINDIFKKINYSDQPFNFKKANDALNTAIEDNKDIPEIKDTLVGLQKVTSNIANTYRPSQLALHGATAALGGYEGYQHGGELGGVIGSMIGLIGGGYVLHQAHQLAMTPEGANILKGLANPGTSMKTIANVIRAIGTGGLDKMVNSGASQ